MPAASKLMKKKFEKQKFCRKSHLGIIYSILRADQALRNFVSVRLKFWYIFLQNLTRDTTWATD